MKSFFAAVLAATTGLAQARFWWDGYALRVFAEEKSSTCSVSVCSTDATVGCLTFQCTEREDVRAINADAWFIQDDHGEEFWYSGPGEGIWMLQDNENGIENWKWIEPLSPIPRNVTLNDEIHNILAGHSTFMAETQQVSSYSITSQVAVVAAAFSLGAITVFVAKKNQKPNEDDYLQA